MGLIEEYRDQLKKHIIAYREANNLTQPQMAKFLGLKPRSYQDIEKTGNAVKVDNLLHIIEKTGFEFTHKSARSDLKIMHGAIRFIIDRAVLYEEATTGKPQDEIRKEFRNTMKEAYGLALEDL